MDSPWRRTLASVFLLLSSHNVRVLCQNVVPNGPLPLVREPIIDGIIPGTIPQWNWLPGLPNAFPGDYISPEYRYIPEYVGQAFPQASPFGPALPANIGSPLQGPVFNIPQLNNVPPLQGPIFNLPSTNVPPPQGPPIIIPQTPLMPVPLGPQSYNSQPTLNIPALPSANIPPLVPIPQGPNCDIPTSINPFPQVLQPPYIPLVPIMQDQILPGPQVPLAPIGALNLPPGPFLPNQNLQVFPLVSPSSPLPYLPPGNGPCTLANDVSSLQLLPNPADLLNYQIAALPQVFPSKPLLYTDSCIETAAEEYSPVPINLHINVPSPTIPEPKITIITAMPPAPASPAVTTSDSSDIYNGFYPPFPLPPIIIESRRSRSRSWLPLLLIALFTGDDYGGGFGGGGCSCSGCDSGQSIPVPYPIPIPTNNPIILGNSCRSQNKSATKS